MTITNRILFDLSCLYVIALVLCVTHREGLAGQAAVGCDSREELVLAHAFKDEA